MANTIYGIANYYNTFASPLQSYQVSPLANLLYGATASKIYSQTVAKKALSSMSSYLTTLNSSIGASQSTVKALAFQQSNLNFNKKKINASDSSSITGTASWNAGTGSHKISIKQLASSQTNKGTELKSKDSSAFNRGLNTFTIKSGDSTKTAAFTVTASDTNKTALDKMADAINKSNSGISATVISDAKTETSYLKLNSNKTGANSSFVLTDSVNNAVSAAGANTISDNAKNAEYTLDRKQYSSRSNTINIDNGKAQITLKKADNKEIRFSIEKDATAIADDIKKFLEDYNKITNYSSMLNMGNTADNSQSFSGMLFDMLL